MNMESNTPYDEWLHDPRNAPVVTHFNKSWLNEKRQATRKLGYFGRPLQTAKKTRGGMAATACQSDHPESQRHGMEQIQERIRNNDVAFFKEVCTFLSNQIAHYKPQTLGARVINAFYDYGHQLGRLPSKAEFKTQTDDIRKSTPGYQRMDNESWRNELGRTVRALGLANLPTDKELIDCGNTLDSRTS